MFLDFQRKEISKPAYWRKKNYEKKTGQHYQEGEKIVTGISTLQQFRNMLVVILVISNPVHWSK